MSREDGGYGDPATAPHPEGSPTGAVSAVQAPARPKETALSADLASLPGPSTQDSGLQDAALREPAGPS